MLLSSNKDRQNEKEPKLKLQDIRSQKTQTCLKIIRDECVIADEKEHN